MADEKNVRHRFTVPTVDTVVNEWIENQNNLGFSLRVLIRAFVRQYGVNVDATCIEFGTPAPAKRGRPPKNRGVQLNGMLLSDESDEDSDDYMTEEVSSTSDNMIADAPNTPIVTTKPVSSVKPVAKPIETEATVHVTSDKSAGSNIMDMLNIGVPAPKQTVQKAPVAAAGTAVEGDDDGFIDPDDL